MAENDENQNKILAKTEIEAKVEPENVIVDESNHDESTTFPNSESNEKYQRLQDYELHRKLMEEQNKMKRNLLQQAISKYAEKTQAEAKKLDEIKNALGLF